MAVQISHRGCKYSIERLLALEEYTKTTSLLRVALVCIATPLPMMALVMLQEAVPLQDPRDGWSANYGFWIRVVILAAVVGHAASLQAEYLIEGVSISRWQVAKVCLYIAVVYPAACSALAAYVVFPIPFMVVSLNLMFFALLACSFRAAVGSRVFREMLSHRDQLLRYVAFVSAQTFMSILYPAYQALFNVAAGELWYELPVIMILPILKLIMKNIILLSTKHMEDMIPEAVIFSVDFFNALFLATSMQSATSTITVAIIMVVDFAQTTTALYSLHWHTSDILVRLQQAVEAESNGSNLLVIVASICRDPEKFEKQVRTGIRLQSCLPHRLSSDGRILLDKLAEIAANEQADRGSVQRPQNVEKGVEISSGASWRTRLLGWVWNRKSARAVHPTIAVKPKAVSSTRFDESKTMIPRPTNHHTKVLEESLSVLFTAECIVLTEYLELLIPLFYGNFMLVMVHLDSAKYHVEMTGVTPENVGSTVRSVFVYAFLELVSFVVLAVVMHRNCGIRALYHLAFVLETQMPLVQGKMGVWMMMTLGFRVVHYGAFTDQYPRGGQSPSTLNSVMVLRFIILVANRVMWHGYICVCTTSGVDFSFQFNWIGNPGN